MRAADIVEGDRYAYWSGYNPGEIGCALVQSRGTIPGTSYVEIIHPEDQAGDPDFRTVENKRLLGVWQSKPDSPQGYQQVTRGKDGEYPTFAEHADWAYGRVQQQRELAGRLQALGLDYPKVSWLGRGGSRFYNATITREFSLSFDELAQLLFLAERQR